MERNKKGVIKWVRTTHLYREWYWSSIKEAQEQAPIFQ